MSSFTTTCPKSEYNIHVEKVLREEDYYKQLKEAILTGPVNVTAYYIYKYLQQGDSESAKLEWQNDGDKIPQNSIYHRPIKGILGCRLHLNIQCDKSYCRY